MSGVTLKNIVKKFGPVEVIHNIDLRIEEGEFCVFVGPSGCGKSTLLRMISGLETTTSGEISIGDRVVTDTDPADRGVAMVFQTYALYPHMSVRENMGFGLKMAKTPKDEIKAKVDAAADILKLGPYMERKPKALSGGQRQRVAIGRAIVRGPEVFLFDEPLSNLDAELRLEMRVEISRLHGELGNTMIYVTHDQVEAMTLADKIVVLRDGHIEQVGAPLHLYSDPDNKFVAGFIGSPAMNFVKATVSSAKKAMVPALGREITASHNLGDKGRNIWVGLRPENLAIKGKTGPLDIGLTENLGGVSYIYLDAASGETLIVEQRGASAPKGGSTDLVFKDKEAFFFDQETEERIRG